MSVRNLNPIHQADLEILHQISENFDLLVALEINPLGTMNVCVEFFANP